MMRRRYFKAQSGRFYRNCPLIMSERKMRINQILPWRASKLRKEWLEVFHAGVRYVDEIKPWDKVVKPASFRKAYPNHPGLWHLDEPEGH